VIIGHCGDTDDLDYLEELLRNGSLLGLDRFGADRYMPVDDRIAMVLELCERGWADRLTLSQDADTFNVLFAPSGRSRPTRAGATSSSRWRCCRSCASEGCPRRRSAR
jgi:phosphotriesterase-related protein